MAIDDPTGGDLGTALVLEAGRHRLAPADRWGDRDVVAVVPTVAAATGTDPATLALLRRADLLVPADAAVADALADRVPVMPWDMLVGPPDPGAVASALARRRGRVRTPRRLALVTPMPPEPTGVAVYSARLAAALGRRVVVDVVVAGPVDEVEAPVGCRVVDVATFEATTAAGRYDEIVYALGNQPRHGTQITLARRWPGAVELHDVRLIGAYAGLHAPGDALADELQRLEPGRFPPDLLREPELRMGPAVAAGAWMVRELAEGATAVLVHSQHAAGLVTAESGVEAVDVGPLACPPVSDGDDDAAGLVPGIGRVVVSVGVVDASKRPDTLVRALALLPDDVVLALVGPADPVQRREVEQLAAHLGVARRVVTTGRVDDAAYRAWLRRADVAVQLRGHSNGESSAAVADCLAHGVATVVADTGSLAELPAEVVERVAPDAGPAALAGAVRCLLDDDGRRRARAAAALAFAAANGFDAAADRLLAALFGPGRA